MSCHICSRSPNSRLPLNCSTCARSRLYQLRIELAGVLLEREAIGRQVEHAVAWTYPRGEPTCSKDIFLQVKDDGPTRWASQTISSWQAQSLARVKALENQVEMLHGEIRDKRVEISQRKAALAQRHSDAESAKYQLAERESAMLTSVHNNTKRTEHLWHALHNKTAEARIFLCREAANLYGLRQKIKKRDGEVKESYVIGGVPIIDLRDMNGATPVQISTAFSNIAHLLVLVSHYLSLRLPAEITLRHRNYPTDTIFAPAGSYVSRDMSTMILPSQLPVSSPRITDVRAHFPRPRPLSIDKSLPRLAKEDPATYALFLEGATLLAWNVSWLCRTQGLSLASDSWEEICDVGKNMWHLLVAPPAQASSLMRAFAGRDVQAKIRSAKDSPKTTIQRTKSFPMLGHYSHGTVHSFLGAAEGTEFMRTWKLPSPTKVVDKLKTTLLGEMASAEWELLEKKEWDDEIQEPVQPTHSEPIVPAELSHRLESGAGDISSEPTESMRLTHPESGDNDPDIISGHSGTSRPRGNSGWTKLKGRQ